MTARVVDQNWVTFNHDPIGICYGDSGAPTFFNGRVVAVASDGALDCVSADNRARVDSKEVRNWIKAQIDQRFPFDRLSSSLDEPVGARRQRHGGKIGRE
jgi:hypothetical protein